MQNAKGGANQHSILLSSENSEFSIDEKEKAPDVKKSKSNKKNKAVNLNNSSFLQDEEQLGC